MSLLLVMGIPAAGKSTLCARLVEYCSNAVLFSLDDTIGRWTDEFRAHAERKSFEQSVHLYLEQNCNEEYDGLIILDDIFYLQSMRRPFIRMARAFGLRYCCVLVKCDVQDALLRNSRRGENRVSDETITRIFQEMELPKDALLYDNQSIEEILQRLGGPRPKRLLERTLVLPQNSKSALSEIDILLRKIVSEAVRQGLQGRILASAKKVVLNRCRNLQCVPSPGDIQEALLEEYQALSRNSNTS